MKCCICWVFEPTLDENAVIRLKREILSHVVHNYCLVKWAADSTEVLYENHARWAGMLSVEAVLNIAWLVDLV